MDLEIFIIANEKIDEGLSRERIAFMGNNMPLCLEISIIIDNNLD